jgi:hypothetical protein
MTNVMSTEAAKAIGMLEAAVAVRGADFNYRQHFNLGQPDEGGTVDCKYVHTFDGEMVPGCIIGMMLHLAGVDLDDLVEQEGQSAWDAVPVFMHFADPSIRAAFDKAQAKQDTGGSWGEALEAARARLAVDG